MNCHDAQSCLPGYLDGELDALTSIQYEQHVHECSACSNALAEQKALQSAMKADALYYKAPDNLRSRLHLALRPGRGRRFRSVAWRWLAVAACLLVSATLGSLLTQWLLAPSKQARLAEEIVACHIRSLQLDQVRLVDVKSSDRHEVKPWFDGKLDFSPRVIDLAQQGFPLRGGRLDYVDGRPIAVLVYQRRKHVINVFVWPDAAQPDTQPTMQTRQGYHLFVFTRAGMSFWVVSDLESNELAEMVQRLRP